MNLKIVGIPGSNANHSYNRMLLEYISKAYEYDMTVVDVRKIPLFNESAKERRLPSRPCQTRSMLPMP
jgi:Predicted flavoprotein